jgi:cell division protein FtsN
MSRDYKTNPNSSNPFKGRNSLVIGIFIGYALGLLTAIATWMYINKAPSPFISADKTADSATAKSGAGLSQKGAQGQPSSDRSTEAKPRFEFYNMLPNEGETVTEQQLKQGAQQPASKDKYFLQAGSFQNASDADNLKAKLAMLGVEATVQAVNVPEKKGTWHRVRVGPFSSMDDLNQVRASLQQNGVQSSLIKVQDGKQ